MKRLALLMVCLIAAIPFSVSVESAYKFRQTIEIVETAGIPRFSFPLGINLPGKDISDSLNDIRITDAEGNFLEFQATGKTGTNVKMLVPVNLKPNEKKTLYAFYGSKDAQPPATSFGGVQQYIGANFVTFAWGTVRISSYTKNNTITVTDNSNKTLADADGANIASEIYQAGTQRTFTLANPSMIKISCTGLSSVAIGNFKAEETDSEALIAGNILLYVPKFLSITSFHSDNSVQVYNGAELAQEKILGVGESLVFDGIPAGFRRIVAKHECLVQYGTASAYSLFSVPGRGNVYRFLPLGPVHLTGEQDTDVDVAYPDGKMADKFSLKKNQVVTLPLDSYLKNIGTDKTAKALHIRSSKPITVLGTGGVGGHGATCLPGNDGFQVSRSWTTMTGDVDKENPSNRTIRVIAPYSNTKITGGDSRTQFPILATGGLAVTPKEFSVEFSGIDIQTSESCLVLDGNPDDTATLFQVPALMDRTVQVIVPVTEGSETGWIPGKKDESDAKPEKPVQENGLSVFLKDVWSRINPRENPLVFALTLIGLAILFILVSSIFSKRKRPARAKKPTQETTDAPETDIPVNADQEDDPPVPEPPYPHAGKTDWFERILEDNDKSSLQAGSFKAPRLRAPKLSQFIDTEQNRPIEFEKTEEEPDLFDAHPESETTKASQAEPETKAEANLEPEPPVAKASEIDRFDLPVSKITPQIRNLAHQLSGEGVVADPGSLVRLYKEGVLDLFSRIYIVAQSALILPAYIANLQILEKVQLTPKELEKTAKLASEMGVFDEVARALVLADKNSLPNFVTTARLPERLGKIKITNVNSFC